MAKRKTTSPADWQQIEPLAGELLRQLEQLGH